MLKLIKHKVASQKVAEKKVQVFRKQQLEFRALRSKNCAKSSGTQSVEGLPLADEKYKLNLSDGISSDHSESAEDVYELPMNDEMSPKNGD